MDNRHQVIRFAGWTAFALVAATIALFILWGSTNASWTLRLARICFGGFWSIPAFLLFVNREMSYVWTSILSKHLPLRLRNMTVEEFVETADWTALSDLEKGTVYFKALLFLCIGVAGIVIIFSGQLENLFP